MTSREKTESSSDILIKIGRRLRTVRELAGTTQSDLCLVLGMDQSTYSRWERGKRVPDVLMLTAFAARYRVSLDFIFRGSPLGVQESLLQLLKLAHADLLADTPTNMEPGTDRHLTSYRESIALTACPQS